MAVIKRGILGGFQNKIGNIVGTSWKGIAVMKSLPLSVANPRTTAQVAQRSDFGEMSKIGSVVLATIVKPLWDRFAQQESGFNAFLKQNIATLTEGNLFNPEDFVISKGKMAAVAISTAVLTDASNNLVVTWPTTLPDAFAATTDKVYIMAISDDSTKTRGYATTAIRSAGTVTVTYPFTPTVNGLQVYLAFLRADGTVVSDSSYKEASVV